MGSMDRKSTARPQEREGPDGKTEHVHPGYGGSRWMYEWHPEDQEHQDANGNNVTESLHEKYFGKDGMGVDTVSRTMNGAKPGDDVSGDAKEGTEDKDPEGGEGPDADGSGADAESGEHGNAYNIGKLAASMIGKNVLMSAGSLTDAAMSGMRRVMSAMMSGNPMSASAKALTDTLGSVGDISKEMADTQRKYGIGAGKDSGTLETTAAGSLMLGEQRSIKQGTADGMANVSKAIERCGAESVETMTPEQLSKVTGPLSDRAMNLMGELTADRQKPSKERMPRAEYRRKAAELKVYADTLKGVESRAKDQKSAAKEYAARLSHEMRYKASRNAEIKRQNKYEAEQRAINRYNMLSPSGKLISDKIGAKVALDENGIPINRSKRTAAKNVLIDEADDLERRINSMSQNNSISPEQQQMVDDMKARMEVYRTTVSEINKREAREKEAQREANRRNAIEGKRSFNSTAATIMDKAHVYESGKYMDQYGVTTGMKNTPQLRNDLGEAIKAREGEALRQAADYGLDVSDPTVREQVLADLGSDPDYVELKSTLSANTESHYKDVVTRQLRDVLSMSDRDIEKVYGGTVDRDMMEQSLRDIEEQYHKNRMASPLRQGEDPSYQAVMPDRDNEEAFSKLMDDTIQKYGLKPLASPRVKKPKAQDMETQQGAPAIGPLGNNTGGGNGGGNTNQNNGNYQDSGSNDVDAQSAEGRQGTAQADGADRQQNMFEGAPTIAKPGRSGSGYTPERILDQTLKQNGNDMNTRFLLDDNTLDDLIMNEPQKLLGAVKGFNKGEAWKGVRGMDSYLNSNVAYMESMLGKWTGQDTSQMTPEQIIGSYYNEAKRRGDTKKVGRAINFANLLKMRNAYDRVEQRNEGVSPTKPFQYNRPTAGLSDETLMRFGLKDYYDSLGDAGKAELDSMDEAGLKALGKRIKANERKARDQKDQRIMDRPEASRDDKPSEYDRAIMLGIAMDHDLNVRPGMTNKELRNLIHKNSQALKVYQNTEQDRKAQRTEWNAKYGASQNKSKASKASMENVPNQSETQNAEDSGSSSEETVSPETAYQDTAQLPPNEFNRVLLYEIASKAGLNVSQDMDTATLQNLVNKYPQLKQVYDGTRDLRKKHAQAFASLIEGDSSSEGTQTSPGAPLASTNDSDGKKKKWMAPPKKQPKKSTEPKPTGGDVAERPVEEAPRFNSLEEMNDSYRRDINDYADMQGYEVPSNLRGSFPDFMSFITSGSPEAEMYMNQYEGDEDLMSMISDYKRDEKDVLSRQKPRHGSRMNRDPENRNNPLKR